jgi:hypothetical protein
MGATCKVSVTEDSARGGGLPGTEAAARLARYGPNETGTERRHRVRALAGRLSGPVPWMLEAAIVLEIAAGKAAEAAIIALLVVFNAVLSSVQEDRAQGALAGGPGLRVRYIWGGSLACGLPQGARTYSRRCCGLSCRGMPAVTGCSDPPPVQVSPARTWSTSPRNAASAASALPGRYCTHAPALARASRETR